ncbi:MAG TPA: hypothetical protein VE954_09935 [Oligoflexus sp.]|uniref:hypothetical protein n=1 Tax=Oligoflexus sp. TaxID=1971216 RepID=UPI002D24DF8E|nr:hypothetical protein [Oligoflexus sp.]HYX33422.1 hypothetical protein [Oligoflexus sp.]
MNERTIFLLDGVGAALSFILSGLILPYFSDALGLSKELIYSLAGIPAICMIFSFRCYGFIKPIKSWMLLTIILANLAYSLISGSLIVFHDGLSDVGKYLLLAEILVVMGVMILEIRVLQKLRTFPRKSL